MNSISIREFSEADQEDLYRLFSLPEMDGDAIPPMNEFESTITELVSLPNYYIFIAELDGSIIGTFGIALVKHISHRGALSGLIKDVIVYPEFRNLEYGRSMMEAAVEHCCTVGCYFVTLCAHRARHDAHRFYENLGFKLHGNSYLLEL